MISHIIADPNSPSCHVCGAIMTSEQAVDRPEKFRWVCRSCGATTDPDKVLAYGPATRSPHEVHTFTCKVCGVQKQQSNHWFVVGMIERDGKSAVAIAEWDEAEISLLRRGEIVPVCGERHGLVLVERWLDRRTFAPFVSPEVEAKEHV